MKRIILSILLLQSLAGFAQYQVNISGTITEGPAGFPVPDQPVYFTIMVGYDSLNIITADVMTNDSGFYSYTFQMNGIYARVDIATPDCNGTMQMATVFASPNATDIIQDFNLCFIQVCQAFFIFDQTGDYTFQFTDQSTGINLNYFWNFGDNGTSTLQNPTYTYNAPGIYEVCLFISAPDSTCFDVYCAQVVAGSAGGCMAQFTSYPDSVPAGYGLQFIDLSSGNIGNWSWSFGDGSYSQEQSPFHVFPGPGQYEVCLSVTGTECQSTWCEWVSVNAPGDCYNYFTYQSAGTSVLFSGEHFPGIPVSFNWDFGDGTTGEGQNVSHSYAANGVYYVSLITSDSMNCSAASSQAVVVGDTILFNQVFGQVFEGNFPMSNGYVMIASVQNNPGFEPFTDVSPVDSSGIFVFPYIPNGQFVLYAVPEEQSGYMPTYYDGAPHWADATVFNSTQAGMIYSIHLAQAKSLPVWGNSSINGMVSRTSVREDLIQRIIMLLYNDAFELIAFTTVQPDGSFEFTSLANGLYYIYPELAGANSSLIPVELSPILEQNFIYLSFDGTSILGEKELSLRDEDINIYPNPATDKINVSIRLDNSSEIMLQVYDLTGRTCYTVSYQIAQGQALLDIPVMDLVTGIYLLHISDPAGNIVTRKFMKR